MFDCKELCPYLFQLDIDGIKRQLGQTGVVQFTNEDRGNSRTDIQVCKICAKVFKSYNTWKQHLRIVHGNAFQHCGKCTYKTKSNYLLKEHKLKWHGTPESTEPSKMAKLLSARVSSAIIEKLIYFYFIGTFGAEKCGPVN